MTIDRVRLKCPCTEKKGNPNSLIRQDDARTYSETTAACITYIVTCLIDAFSIHVARFDDTYVKMSLFTRVTSNCYARSNDDVFRIIFPVCLLRASRCRLAYANNRCKRI